MFTFLGYLIKRGSTPGFTLQIKNTMSIIIQQVSSENLEHTYTQNDSIVLS